MIMVKTGASRLSENRLDLLRTNRMRTFLGQAPRFILLQSSQGFAPVAVHTY